MADRFGWHKIVQFRAIVCNRLSSWTLVDDSPWSAVMRTRLPVTYETTCTHPSSRSEHRLAFAVGRPFMRYAALIGHNSAKWEEIQAAAHSHWRNGSNNRRWWSCRHNPADKRRAGLHD